MAVSFRAVGTWAEFTADGSVVIPATPQAGDRMYLFARWKDFSVTAQLLPSGWVKIPEFADGAVSSGNGTGSVKVACWWRDWQSGDVDPTFDFSANPDNASAVIIVMSKDAGEAWLTPVAVTAAMTNWTTTAQIVSASSTAVVPSDGVVMGLIGIRDDTATMTRPTSGIDDSAGAITWNGNYVEAPATHHSTTTGFDGAADLGYRLVSVGATATLRMTGTISAAETGAALWVVQGVEFNLTVESAAHTHTADDAALTQVHAVAVQGTEHAQTAASLSLTQVHVINLQDAAHAHAVEGLTLSQAHSLGVQEAVHTHAVENPDLTLTFSLVIQDAGHDHASESLTVQVIYELAIQDAGHTHNAEDVVLAQTHELLIANADHVHTAQSPSVRTILIVYLDPGGDATHAVGHFNNDVNTTGLISYDPTQQVAGAGSYKFDSSTGLEVPAAVNGVLDNARRVSSYFRYDSQPDATETVSDFPTFSELYSGEFPWADDENVDADDGLYATATPAKNAGQGGVFGIAGALGVPVGAIIDSVKIIYERKYDTDASIGISRVKWRVDGVEGPDHDNTDMPLTDTVVEVDVTADRAWEWQYFQAGRFEVIAEARRGDTDTAHTQSWDYIKVEVVFHQPAVILAALSSSNLTVFRIAINPKGAGAVLRFIDGAGNSYDGITPLLVNTNPRIGFSYVYHAVDNLDIKLSVNGIQELSITGASTGGFAKPVNFNYGWLLNPGANHLCWFRHLYIDDGEDLSDPGDVLCTAKLPAAVNEDNWDTTGGTGAVNERPLSETNYRMQSAFSSVRQTYTLQAAATGDVDLTGKIIRGYMGWAWAKRESGSVERIGLIVNNVDVSRGSAITTSPSLLKLPVTSTSYPSHAAGIGMSSNSEDAGVFMYDIGAVIAYEIPVVNPNSLMAYQILAEGSITNLTDDLRADPQDSYELCYRIDDGDASVLITIYSILSEGQPPQLQGICGGQGGYGRTRITPGVEVQVVLEVTGGSAGVSVWRRVNIA